MRKWQIITIPIAVFVIVCLIGLIFIRPIEQGDSLPKDASEISQSSEQEKTIEEEEKEKEENKSDEKLKENNFDGQSVYKDYLKENEISFKNKTINVTETINETEYVLNSIENEDGTNSFELLTNDNGFSVYNLKDKVYIYTSTIVEGQKINSWAFANKDEEYVDIANVKDYFNIDTLTSEIKSAKSLEYDKSEENNDTTYDTLIATVDTKKSIIQDLEIDITDEKIVEKVETEELTEEEIAEEEKEKEKTDESITIKYSLYVNRETKQIEKITYETDAYKETITITDTKEIEIPEDANISEEMTSQDLEWLLLGVKMSMS